MIISSDLMTEREAAEYLLIRRATLAVWRRRGVGLPYMRLPSVGTGERSEIRYRRSDLEGSVSSALRGVSSEG